MNILLVGDIIGKPGVAFIQDNLSRIKREYAIDLCIANGENSAWQGINPAAANNIFRAGADIITLGNHGFAKSREADEVLTSSLPVIRPANYPDGTAGEGYMTIHDVIPVAKTSENAKENLTLRVTVVNLMGRIFMDPVDCPFRKIDAILEQIESKIIIVDFHAEATSEKVAMKHHLDGRVTAIFGTHTHVQTADEVVTERGTAYITDIGMTGPIDSVLGAKKENVLHKFIKRTNRPLAVAEGPIRLCGAVLDIDNSTGKARSIERIQWVS